MAGGFKVAFGSFLKTVHQLWLEVSGALFIVLGLGFGFEAFREYRAYGTAASNSGWLIGAATMLSVLTLSFGIHSLWKARKLR